MIDFKGSFRRAGIRAVAAALRLASRELADDETCAVTTRGNSSVEKKRLKNVNEPTVGLMTATIPTHSARRNP